MPGGRGPRWLVVLLLGVALLVVGMAGPAGRGALPRARALPLPRIQNGAEASTARYPFVVGVSTNPVPVGADPRPGDHTLKPSRERTDRSGVFCGGTLVAGRFVLTAAHCVSTEEGGRTVPTKDRLWVIAGRDDLSRRTGKEVSVTKVWLHPEHRAGSVEVPDLAVLTLAWELLGSLPLAGMGDEGIDAPGTRATVLGYGRTGPDGVPPRRLLGAELPLRPPSDCRLPEFGDSLLCFGGRLPGEGQMCIGDSGDPLIAGGRLIGVHNGVRHPPGQKRVCSTPEDPAFMTRVRPYRDQLADVIARKKADARPEVAYKDYSCATGENRHVNPVGTIRAKFGRLLEDEQGLTVEVSISYMITAPFLVDGGFDGENANVVLTDDGGTGGTVTLNSGDRASQDGAFHPLGEHNTYTRRVGKEFVRFDFEFDSTAMKDTFSCSARIPSIEPFRWSRPGGEWFHYTCGDGGSWGTIILLLDGDTVESIAYEADSYKTVGKKVKIRIYDEADSDEPFVSIEPVQKVRAQILPDALATRPWHNGPWKFSFEFSRVGFSKPRCVAILPGVP